MGGRAARSQARAARDVVAGGRRRNPARPAGVARIAARARSAASTRLAAVSVTAAPGEAWNPVLSESLYDLLYRADAGKGGLASELARLEVGSGDAVYAELIYLLSHLRFPPDEARRCWEQIVAHRDTMQKKVGAQVDLRVALVSYFLEVNRKLKSPKVIELKLFEQTQASAYRDDLTGLWNYRYFREYLEREIQRSRRYNPPLSLVMVDIDDFKQYNDRNGHEAGNQALTVTARLLTETLRQIDVAARYGGEEFAVILPATSKIGAQQVAERIRERIERQTFPRQGGHSGALLTVSMGVATFPADARDHRGLVRCADAALYAAKTRGKNQVHLYGENRRSYRRVDASLDGRFSMLATESHPLTTVNVSEGGLLFFTGQPLPVGSLIDVNLRLPDAGGEIAASGRVIRVEEQRDGRYEAAVRVIDMPARDQALLAGYLRGLGPEHDTPHGGS